MVNFIGSEGYDCKHPWVYKYREYGLIAADIFIYVDNGKPIGPIEDIFWELSRNLVSTCSWLGIQDASHEVKPPLQAPGIWSETVTTTDAGVDWLVSQDRWDKTKSLIQEVRKTRKGGNGMDGVEREML